MTKSTKISLSVVLLSFAFLFTNFKSLENTNSSMSSEELTAYLHGGSSKDWSASSFSLLGLINMQKCRLDDRMTLKSDGTFQYDGGKDLCGREDNQRFRNGTWTVMANGEKIVFEFERGKRRKKTETHEAFVADTDNGRIVLVGKYKKFKLKAEYQAQ